MSRVSLFSNRSIFRKAFHHDVHYINWLLLLFSILLQIATTMASFRPINCSYVHNFESIVTEVILTSWYSCVFLFITRWSLSVSLMVPENNHTERVLCVFCQVFKQVRSAHSNWNIPKLILLCLFDINLVSNDWTGSEVNVMVPSWPSDIDTRWWYISK